MSRTTQKKASNPLPISGYIRFSGSEGVWTYYESESKTNYNFTELNAVLVDVRSSITGWNEETNSRIYSNLVKNTRQTPMRVMGGAGGELANGLYNDIKDEVKKKGGRFATNLFALVEIDDTYVPVMITLSGGALGEWMNLTKNLDFGDLFSNQVKMTIGEQHRKGAVKYYLPKFEMTELSDDIREQADRFDHEVLQPYFMVVDSNNNGEVDDDPVH